LKTVQNMESAKHMPTLWCLWKVLHALEIEDINFYVIQNYDFEGE
jgi:hypothetical protein